MLNQKISIIGTGQMGGALIRSLIRAEIFKPERIIGFDVDREKIELFSTETGILGIYEIKEAIEKADIILLAVKPQNIDDVLQDISDYIKINQLIISIAAGITLEHLYSFLGNDKKVIRVMPNTPAQVGQGISVISPGENIDQEMKNIAEEIFKAAGEVIFLDEKFQAQATAISGSGPAYFFLFTEALVDAGVKQGLDSEIVKKLVIETMLGSAKLMKVTDRDPTELREAVSSPGGTTLAALKVFDESGFREVVTNAIDAAIKRAYELGQ